MHDVRRIVRVLVGLPLLIILFLKIVSNVLKIQGNTPFDLDTRFLLFFLRSLAIALLLILFLLSQELTDILSHLFIDFKLVLILSLRCLRYFSDPSCLIVLNVLTVIIVCLLRVCYLIYCFINL